MQMLEITSHLTRNRVQQSLQIEDVALASLLSSLKTTDLQLSLMRIKFESNVLPSENWGYHEEWTYSLHCTKDVSNRRMIL